MTRLPQAALLFLALFLAHYAYKTLGVDHEDRAWWQYRLRGIEGAVLWAFVWTICWSWGGWLGRIGMLICAWGLVQEAETYVCSFGGDLPIPFGKGLCTAHYGPWFQYTVASGAGAYLIVRGTQEWLTLRRRRIQYL